MKTQHNFDERTGTRKPHEHNRGARGAGSGREGKNGGEKRGRGKGRSSDRPRLRTSAHLALR